MTKLEQIQEHLRYLKKDMGMKWSQISALPEFQDRIPIGTLSAIMNGRDPKDPITRAILDLPPHSDCGQCWRFNRYIEAAVNNQRPRAIPRKWRDFPTVTLRMAMEFRQEFTIYGEEFRDESY